MNDDTIYKVVHDLERNPAQDKPPVRHAHLCKYCEQYEPAFSRITYNKESKSCDRIVKYCFPIECEKFLILYAQCTREAVYNTYLYAKLLQIKIVAKDYLHGN